MVIAGTYIDLYTYNLIYLTDLWVCGVPGSGAEKVFTLVDCVGAAFAVMLSAAVVCTCTVSNDRKSSWYFVTNLTAEHVLFRKVVSVV